MNPWIIVPAAGVGRRFGGDIPKQYQRLQAKTVIEHTLERLLSLHSSAIVVAVHQEDDQWRQLDIFQHPQIRTVQGGNERVDSVRLAMESLHQEAASGDWVLVHDVARPCVQVADIEKLMEQLQAHNVGGILATPVSDTIKRVANSVDIASTEDRSQLWAAQTPQMFRYGLLLNSLQIAREQQRQPTDEAAAIESLGHTPQVVEGSRDNIKITRTEDMAIAEAIMTYQQIHRREK